MKHTIYICKKTMNEVAIRDLRKQLQEQEQKTRRRKKNRSRGKIQKFAKDP